MLSGQRDMAQDAVGRKQSIPQRVVVEPKLIIFPHTNAAVRTVSFRNIIMLTMTIIK